MPADLSIVIPTLNAAAALPRTADHLLEGVGSGLIRDLIVSDGGSDDETLAVAEELGAVVVRGEAGRGGQIARGVAAARAPWVLILHADTHLSEGWTAPVAAHMSNQPERAGHFRLAFRARGLAPRIVAGGANLRSRLFALPYGDQGLLVTKALLDRIGGIPDIPLMEDVALARRLGRARLTSLDATAMTSADRYQRDGWARRVISNLGTLGRFALGADPERLARRYASRN